MTTLNHHKFSQTVLYLLKRCGRKPGITLLNKLLFLSDKEHYRRHLITITGADYVADERGPVVDGMRVHMSYAIHGGIVERDKTSQGDQYTAKFDPNLKMFKDTEIEVLNEVAARHGRKSGNEMSDFTHRGLEWGVCWSADHPFTPIPRALFNWEDNLATEPEIATAIEALQSAEMEAEIKTLYQA